MSAPDIFGICVRVIGLLIAIYGFWCIPFAFQGRFFSVQDDDYESSDYLTGGITLAAIGLALLFGAKYLSEWTY